MANSSLSLEQLSSVHSSSSESQPSPPAPARKAGPSSAVDARGSSTVPPPLRVSWAPFSTTFTARVWVEARPGPIR
ncbi:hypothetical protein SKAU_G00188060 [Synaphobranchus kaupii]|uniref:Uncharacterized protein n=1 Tax=Synaphobranchus kaupii TaxID=118154 RepID=A0A9Q1FD48_SYNKA|nr:hypothetical protein SKAU_G00188060 [Synaphobranchus kaupii]